MHTNVAQSPTSRNSNSSTGSIPRTRSHTRCSYQVGTFFCASIEVERLYGDQIGRAGLAIYRVLEKHADNQTRRVRMLQTTITRESGYSLRTVKAALLLLEKLCLIAVKLVWHRNSYTLLEPWRDNCNEGAMAAPLRELDKSKEQNVIRPAGPSLNPAPAQPRTRHYATSSRIARKFCEDRRISSPWERQRLTQRIEDMLNAGLEEAAIVAELDREHQAKLEAAKARPPHRGTWRRRDDNLARVNAACVYREPETPEELEIDQQRQAVKHRDFVINLARAKNPKTREDMLRLGHCTLADIDEGFRLVAEGGI